MKNKHKNKFWVFFLVWVLVSGTFYGTLQCKDPANPACHRPFVTDSSTVHFCSEWDNHFSSSELIPLGAKNKGIVCQNPLCRPAGNLLNCCSNTIPTPKSGMVRPMYLPGPFMDENHRSNLFFARHEIKQSVSIYTIVQSFLC